MIRALRWTAFIGLSVGIASLALAVMIGGNSVRDLWDRANFNRQACGDNTGPTGAPSERRLAWSGGDTIEIAVPATIRLRIGEGDDIVVRGSPGTISHVGVRENRLVLDCRWQTSSRNIEIGLPGKAFRHIGLSGSTKLELENLSQPELDLRINGSGNVQAQGTVGRLSLKVSGSGKARFADVAMKSLILKITGSGDVEAAPREEADVSIAGSGVLRRPAKLNTDISGSGRVLQSPIEASEKK
jgi:hypothetical protein